MQSPPDDALRQAFADAYEGKRVLFLTPTRAGTGSIVARAVRLVEERLGESQLSPVTSPWHLKTLSGGWVFFFPCDEIGPEDDVQSPDFVYYPDDRDYMRHTYMFWRGKQLPKRPPVHEHGRSIWQLLRDDD